MNSVNTHHKHVDSHTVSSMGAKHDYPCHPQHSLWLGNVHEAHQKQQNTAPKAARKHWTPMNSVNTYNKHVDSHTGKIICYSRTALLNYDPQENLFFRL